SSASSAGILYESLSHRPRSIVLHFWLQKGNCGQSLRSWLCMRVPQIGHFALIMASSFVRRRTLGRGFRAVARSRRLAVCLGRLVGGLARRFLLGLGCLLVRFAAVVRLVEAGPLEQDGRPGAEEPA